MRNSQLVRVVAVQTGPAKNEKQYNVEKNLAIGSKALDMNPDFIVFPELCNLPYWFTSRQFDPKYFGYAEELDGPTVTAFGELAKSGKCYVLLPFYEKCRLEEQYYNSAVLLDPNGHVVQGILPGGSKVRCYRKNHIGRNLDTESYSEESPYLGLGNGFPVFNSRKAKVGVLICRDRWFPESWRTLALSGAEIVFVPATSEGTLRESYVHTMRTWAQENQVFAVGTNRYGIENYGRVANYYGMSCIVGPRGEVISRARPNRQNVLIFGEFDLAEIKKVRKQRPYFMDRRPELYDIITQKASNI